MSDSFKTFLKHTAKDFHNQSVNPPVVRASTIIFKSMQHIRKTQAKAQKNPKGGHYDYGRQGTSTTHILQKILTKLEESYHVFTTPTGLGSVFLAIFSIVRPGDEILVADPVYSPTRLLTQDYLNEFKIKTIFYNPSDLKTLQKNITKKTKLIFVENPGSNSFEFQDLGKIISIAKKNKILTVIDNTWATPYYFKPIKFGFDMSIVSATKYYSGHSDVMGGSLAVNKKVFNKVRAAEKITGLRLGPDDAYLITRGLRTLDVRLDRHRENAKKVAAFLSKYKKFKLLYPYKKNSYNFRMWKKYYSGASGLMGLKIKAKNVNSIRKFVNSLKLFGYGYSWGGFESLALHQEFRETGKRRYLNLAKDEHLVRLHIGLEDPNDLIADIKQALRHFKMSSEKFIPNKAALITLIAASLIVIISLGIRQTFGLFFFDFEIDLGRTQTQFGFAMGIQLLFWGLLGPVFGVVTDKYGGRIAVIIGFLFYLAGIYFLNYGPNTGSWFIFDIGILVGIGLGATAISIPVSIVAKHFPLNTRTMAIGIVTAAGSFGYFISPMYTRYTLLEFGWNTTLVIFGIMIIAGLIIAFFLSTPMEQTNQENEINQTAIEAIKEAFSNKSFNYLTLGFFVCGWHIALVATHIPMHIRDNGLEDWTATAILALIGLFNIFGTLSSGYLSTRISKKNLLSAIYLLRGVSLIYFVFMPPSVINALIFGITFGYLWLATVPPTNGIVGHIFGTKYISLLYGFVFLSHQVGSFLGAYLGGLFHDLYGSLDYAWYISIALSLFAGLIHLPIKEKAIERQQLATSEI